VTCPERVKAAKPVSYVSKDDPPFLVMYGLGDCLVVPKKSRLLYDALRAAGGCADLHLIPELAHADKRFITAENESLVDTFRDSILKR
jgi:dipeptidyl aminopeptidase/acylaminoacyl peptidase